MPDPLRQARQARKQGDWSRALAVLQEALRRRELDPIASGRAGRLLDRVLAGEGAGSVEVRVHVLGACTTTWLAPQLTAAAWGRGLRAAVTEGAYDSVVQELHGLAPGAADVVVLLPWSARLVRSGSVEDELELWRTAWALARERGLKILQVGYDWTSSGALGHHLGATGGNVATVRRMNDALREALPDGAYLVDLERVSGEVGRARFYEPRRYYWTKQPFSDVGVHALAAELVAGLRALVTGPRKVLVLDLDNTLWGGVVGEEGPLGIALGDSPDGEAFRAFQEHCKALAERGVLLAVSSKNNPDDAREPFEQNPDMVLALSDFAAFEANWEPKAQAIEQMSRDLRLGLSSFVFFDDNPAEREQVLQALPEVEVVDVPPDPADYVRALEAGAWFEALAITGADLQRGAQYRTERKRREARSEHASLDGYLASLEMVGALEPVDGSNLQRVVQLLGKTNQFNLTTRRHPARFVTDVAADGRSVGLAVRVRDRFGDHGLVSVLLAVPSDPETLRIDTWLMSCRVIARGVELFAFAALLERARALGYERLVGEYVPTRKNGQVADLYPRLGFTAAPPDGDAHRFVARADALDVPTSAIRRADE